MIVYCVTGGGEPSTFYASAREAARAARATSATTGDTYTVERCALVPWTRANVLRILNQAGGYVAHAVPVATFRDGRKTGS
jgi:hypothetical protein